MIDICRKGGLTPFLDMAYQGFRQGLEEDAAAIHQFAKSGLNFLLSTSFSKSFKPLRRTHRCAHRRHAECVRGRRRAHAVEVDGAPPTTPNPPSHGARIVSRVLNDPAKYQQWLGELAAMRNRIRKMRQVLADEMARIGSKRDFSFVTRQNGMFSFTGLSPEQIDRLADEFGIYAVRNGRICICGLNMNNVEYVAKSIAAVL